MWVYTRAAGYGDEMWTFLVPYETCSYCDHMEFEIILGQMKFGVNFDKKKLGVNFV
jgi:hypothetical protein